jgi:hypothetical protein
MMSIAFCNFASAAGLETVLMPGEVVQAHAKTESTCSACHQTFDKAAQPKLCMACHKEIASDVKARRGFHGRLTSSACRTCHTEHKGRQFNIVKLDAKTFRHDQTDFVLLGAHKTTTCNFCHLPNKKFRDAPSACIGCHRKDDFHKATMGSDCAKCHSSTDWKQARFNHADTGFILRGKHSTAKCAACHTPALGQSKLVKECVGCHKGDDVHKGSMGPACSSCHSENSWRETRFDHSKTGFALTGKHLDTQCTGCHKQANVFRGAPTQCFGCHQSDDMHKGSLGNDCKACHQPQAWKPSRGFDHAKTRFPLIGKHRDAACLGCHKTPTHFRGIAGKCIDCHLKDDTHKGKNGSECASCHSAESWKTSSFDHSRMTKFPLLGGHGKISCQSCHKGDLHKEKLDMRCVSCHRVKDPHKGRLGDKCDGCHNSELWTKVQVDHNLTAFPLLGQHRITECKSCHVDQTFRGTPTACIACHKKNDKHSGGFGERCDACHSARDWRLWEFDHDKKTQFALLGAHSSLKCESCHNNSRGRHIALSKACGSCHSGDDIHNGSFGMQCDRCHNSTSFKDIAR